MDYTQIYQGLAAAKTKGKILGRPKGSKSNKIWDCKEAEILNLINKGITLRSVWKLIDLGSYQGFYLYCTKYNKKIKEAYRVQKDLNTSLIAHINQRGKK